MKKLHYGTELQTETPDFFDGSFSDEFNILRENADQHLAFGIGRHTCCLCENQLP